MKSNKVSGEGLHAFDWNTIHQRLAVSAAAAERGFKPTPEERDRILRRRAELLAKPVDDCQSVDDRLEVLEFLIADEKYGVESRYVGEVYALKDVTPLPCTPEFVLGIINVRGQILSVIDLRAVFEMTRADTPASSKIITLRTDEMELAIQADAISGIRSVSVTEIDQSPATITGVRAEYLKGVTPSYVALLDVPRILSDKRIIVHEEIDG